MRRASRDSIVVIIAVVGIIATVGMALLMRNNQQEEMTRWLGERAELISRATEDTVANTFHDLSAVAAYLNSSDTMTQDQFAGFVEQLDLNAGCRQRSCLQSASAAVRTKRGSLGRSGCRARQIGRAPQPA